MQYIHLKWDNITEIRNSGESLVSPTVINIFEGISGMQFPSSDMKPKSGFFIIQVACIRLWQWLTRPTVVTMYLRRKVQRAALVIVKCHGTPPGSQIIPSSSTMGNMTVTYLTKSLLLFEWFQYSMLQCFFSRSYTQ